MRVFRTGEIVVSVVTVAELQYGVSKSEHKERNQAALEAFLLPLEIANFSLDETVVYGNVLAELERRGQTIGPLNTMIAAHALSLDVPLVTNNTRKFERVKGLRVEDWTK
jgi:tRNA(fMet)-specific endonuclease VapC